MREDGILEWWNNGKTTVLSPLLKAQGVESLDTSFLVGDCPGGFLEKRAKIDFPRLPHSP
jgi:hypothetical protein